MPGQPSMRTLRYPARSPFSARLCVRWTLKRTHAIAEGATAIQACSYEQKAERLKRWILEHSGSLATDLTPRNIPCTGGHGMVAEEHVLRGQVLVQIPSKVMMTMETARESPLCGQLIKEAELTEWQALTLHLLCERAAGEGSFWAPYLQLLPEPEQACCCCGLPASADPKAWLPLAQMQHPFFMAAQLSGWLQGSPLLQRLQQRLLQIQEDTELLQVAGANELPIARAWAAAGGGELVSEPSARWAAAVLLSRAFSLDLREVEPLEGDMSYFGSWQAEPNDALALVPWADMLQHCSEAGSESCLRYNVDLGCAVLSAHRVYEAGEQVFDSYGPNLSPGDLLLDYGFVDEGNRNHRFDAPAELVVQPRSSRNRALLGALSALQGEGAAISLGPAGPDETALTWVRAALATDAELVKSGWRVKATPKDVELACRVMGRVAEPLSAATEAKVLHAFEGFIERQLAAYPSSRQQDEQQLQQQDLPWARRQALCALVSEKIALQSAQQVVVQWLARLGEGCPVAELYNFSLHGDGAAAEFYDFSEAEEGEEDW